MQVLFSLIILSAIGQENVHVADISEFQEKRFLLYLDFEEVVFPLF